MQWPDRASYLSADRLKWLTYSASEDKKVLSGWVQTFGALTEIVVNGAGHLAPMNQPERLLEMISTFIRNEKFDTDVTR